MHLRRTIYLILVLISAGCDPDPDPVVTCTQTSPTVAQGVYGCLKLVDDVGNPPKATPLHDVGVEIFTSEPPSTPDDGLVPLARDVSDDIGFYEIALDAGDYWICTTSRGCGQIHVVANQTTPEDYMLSAVSYWFPRS